MGDQAVGKSSIINRFIYDIFDGNEHVIDNPLRDQPSGSTLYLKTSFLKIKLFAFSFGIQPDSRGSKP
ncbi:MAG: hypothetical protein KDD45_13815 [Bdellovibrionales bacterium]|nr:hypothetical protein [Bdellovibrionales bacterium]